jgi:hypothetical protein
MSMIIQSEFRCDFCGVRKYDDHASDFTEVFEDLHVCLECQSAFESLVSDIAIASCFNKSMKSTDSVLFSELREVAYKHIKF